MITIPLRDSTFSHCEFSNNPMPPKTFSKYIKWDRSGAGDPEKTVYTDSHLHECRGGIGWIIEPRELMPHLYEYVKNNTHQFKQIWTHDRRLYQEAGANTRFVPFGGCWIDKQDQFVHLKNKNFSIIASGKRQLQGHQLRHQIIEASGSHIDVFGNGYVPIKDKIEGLKDYRYHFAIENSKTDYWFTEKLIDCLRTGTIPIYWGTPSIGDFFDTDGFIIFNTLEELKEKIKLCTPEYYTSKLSTIEYNYRAAEKYILAEDWIYKFILNEAGI